MDEGQGLCLTLVQFALILKHLLPKTHLLLGCELLRCCLSDCARQGPSRTPERRLIDLNDGGRCGQARRTFCASFAVFPMGFLPVLLNTHCHLAPVFPCDNIPALTPLLSVVTPDIQVSHC